MEKNETKRKLQIACLIGLGLLVLIPLFLFNTQKDVISETEKRYLASLPPLRLEDGSFNKALPDEFAAYLSDRIGLRPTFIRTTSRVKLYAFGQSPNDDIHKGRDGWYFFKGDHNLDIASGTFPLGEKELRDIAANQTAIQAYYAEKGAKFFVMINPSKVSIYPEYIGGGNFEVRPTPADLIADELRRSTEVPVVNPKPRLLANKDKGQEYLKQDSHWNTLGAYRAYEEILSVMHDAGAIGEETLIPAKTVMADYGSGEFSDYFGGILSPETAPQILYTPKAAEVTAGSFYEQLFAICEASPGHDLTTSFAVFENPDAKNGTLLIYGDSQLSSERKVPNYLAEHFKTVVNVGIIPGIDEKLDDYLQPDVVLYCNSERRSDVGFYQFGLYSSE